MKLNYTLSLILVSLLSLSAHYFLFSQLQFGWNVWIWVLYIYFPLMSLIINQLLMKQMKGRPQTFVTVFMGSMAAKLFISLILLLFVLYFNPDIKVPFAISFLYLYLLYTVLNTIHVFRKLQSN